MFTSKRIPQIIYILIVLFSTIFLVVGLHTNTPLRNQLFNSDGLYLFTVFKDLYDNEGSIHQWVLSPSPYFFPDFLILATIRLFIQDYYYQVIGYSSLQWIIFCGLLWWLYQSLYQNEKFKLEENNSDNWQKLLMSFIVISIFYFSANKSFQIFNLVIFSSHHFGGILSVMLFSIVLLKFIPIANQLRIIHIFYLPFFTVLAFVISLSDLLHYAAFILPLSIVIVVYLIINYIKVGKIINIPMVILVCLINLASFIAHKALPLISIPDKFTQPKLYLQNLNYFSENFVTLLSETSSIILIYLAIALIVLILIGWLILIDKQKRLIKWHLSSFEKLFWIYLFLVFLILLPSTLLVNKIPSNRYIAPFIYFSLFFFVGYLIARIPKKTILPTLIIPFGVMGIVMINISNEVLSRNIELEYYPEDIKCIDQALDSTSTSGIAPYWHTNRLILFSKKIKNLAQYSGDGKLMFSNNSKSAYRNSYDFAITPVREYLPIFTINIKYLFHHFGYPRKQTICGDYHLLDYQKHGLPLH